MSKNIFRHARTEDNMVIYENKEIKIKNLITQAQADERMRDPAVANRTDARPKSKVNTFSLKIEVFKG